MKNCAFLDTKNVDKDKQLFDIAEKLYSEGIKTVIYTSSEDRANDIDRFLWVFKQESFIPHKIFIYDEENPLEMTAVIYREFNPLGAKAIIVDQPCNFHFATAFDDIFEFVDYSSEKSLRESRARFKKYKELGFNMKHEKQEL